MGHDLVNTDLAIVEASCRQLTQSSGNYMLAFHFLLPQCEILPFHVLSLAHVCSWSISLAWHCTWALSGE